MVFFSNFSCWWISLPKLKIKFTQTIVSDLFSLRLCLRIGGNRFRQEVNSPPWDFPLEKAPVVKNISGPPTTKSNAIQNYPSRGSIVRHEKKRLGPGGIVLLVGGITLVVTFTALFVVFTMKKVHEKKINLKISNILPRSLPLDKSEGESFSLLSSSSFLPFLFPDVFILLFWCCLSITRYKFIG